MAKLSDPMIKALRRIAHLQRLDGKPASPLNEDGTPIHGRTLTALQERFMIKRTGPRQFQITAAGKAVLRGIERAEEEARKAQERAARPVPATAFVEPSARNPVNAFPEYEDETPDAPPTDYRTEEEKRDADAPFMEEPEITREQDEAEKVIADATFADVTDEEAERSRQVAREALEKNFSPVQLSPRPTGYGVREPEATDAEILQLLALLDAGVVITRKLYHEWEITGARRSLAVPFPLDPVRVAKAASEAVASHLAVPWELRPVADANMVYQLRAEPIHLVTTDPAFTCCRSRLIGRVAHTRIRYTMDPAKVTHERCKP